MPLCEGQSAGPGHSVLRPAGRNDSSVRCRQGDLTLCDACNESRFPAACDNVKKDDGSKTTKINDENKISDSALSACAVKDTAVKCELLCFIQEKSSIMTVDDIVKVCSDFYKKDEIFAARTLLDEHVTQRLPRRKGADSHRATVEDLVKCCLDPHLPLPTFYATVLKRLPPVDASHCDVSAILKELQGLRSEVRQIVELRGEVYKLQCDVRQIEELKDVVSNLRNEVANLRQDLQKVTDGAQDGVNGLRLETAKKFNVLAAGVKDEIGELRQGVKSLNVVTSLSHAAVPNSSPSSNKTQTETHSTSFADKAKDLASSPSALAETKKLRRPLAVYGKNASTSVKSIEGVRRVDIFISRLHPELLSDNIVQLVKTSFPDCTSVTAEKLETRFDTYSSFHVELCASRSMFTTLLDLLYDPESWPDGVLVRRFFRSNRNGANR